MTDRMGGGKIKIKLSPSFAWSRIPEKRGGKLLHQETEVTRMGNSFRIGQKEAVRHRRRLKRMSSHRNSWKRGERRPYSERGGFQTREAGTEEEKLKKGPGYEFVQV